MTAKLDDLGALHDIIAQKLKKTLEEGVPVFDDNGKQTGTAPAGPAYFSAAIRFLKDNDIKALAAEGSEIEGLLHRVLEEYNDADDEDDQQLH